jgi:hypothetical protein
MSAKVVSPVPSSVSLVDHVINLVTSLVEPVDKFIDLIPYSVNPTLPSENVTQAVDPFPPVDPILPLGNETQVVYFMSLSINPTLFPMFFSLIQNPSPMKPLPSNEGILFYLGVLTGPRLPSHIPFKITLQVCVRDVPHVLIDVVSSISILSSIAWQDLGYPQLVLVTQTLFAFNRRTSHPLGILP